MQNGSLQKCRYGVATVSLRVATFSVSPWYCNSRGKHGHSKEHWGDTGVHAWGERCASLHVGA